MTPTIVNTEPSIADMRVMLGAQAPAKEPEAQPATSEPVAEPAAEETTQAAPETVETKQDPEEIEEPLPRGVQKRIAKEVERIARAEAEIAHRVSERKAKEAELAKLTETEKGSEPVKPPQSAEGAKHPEFGETGHENETYEQFHRRELDHVKNETLREWEARQATTAAEARTQERLSAAIAKHGKDFPAMADTVCSLCPVPMQTMIGAMKEWDTLAAHLAKNQSQLKDLAAEFESNPYEVAAKLGRIRDALISKTDPKTATPEKPLPEPIVKVGGTASASGKDLQATLEGGSMSQFRTRVKKNLGR